MTPEQLNAWIVVAQALTNVGIDIAGKIKGWITDAHPSADPAEIDKAYAALLADALVRENLARQAAGDVPSTPPTA